MEETGQEVADNSTSTRTQSTEQQTFKLWKFDLSLTFIKSIFGILTIVLCVLSLVCLIVLGAAKRVDCYAAYTAAYGFYNFAFASCFITYLLRFIIFVLSLDTKLLWVFPWLIWNVCVCAFFALLFFFSSIAVLANSCGNYYGGYKAAGAFGFITCFVMIGEFVFNFIRLRRDHPPTENRFLLLLGVERTPPGTSPVYDQDGNSSNTASEDPKY